MKRQPWVFVRLCALLVGVSLAALAGGAGADLPGFEYVELKRLSAYEVLRRYAGRVESQRRTMLSFQIGGALVEVRVDAGDAVVKGTTLAVLDRRLLRANLNRAEADVSAAQAQAQLALTTLKRTRDLFGKGHSSQQMLDRSSSEARVAGARLAQARAAREQVQIKYRYGQIEAPFTGVIQQRLLDEGSVVAPGVPVLELVETGSLEVRIGIPVAVAEDMRVGQSARIRIGEITLPVRLRGITPAVDDASRTLTAVYDLQQTAGAVPGALAELQLARTTRAEGYWLPVTALTEARRGLWAVLVAVPNAATGDYHVERRLVEALYTEGGRAYVQGTLSSGERVIAAGVELVVPGQRVQLLRPHTGANGGF